MRLDHHDPVSGGWLHLFVDHHDAGRNAYPDARAHPVLTIAWNRGSAQRVLVDDVPVPLPPGAFVTLVAGQSFRFDRTSALTVWQFDRAFYCIIDHDTEVSCAGLLFYGSTGVPILRTKPADHRVYAALLDVFVDEMKTSDAMQGEMLRMLLKRLIIKLTRLARAQLVPATLDGTELDLVRRFNVLVEQHHRTHHRVADYADMLNRSAKTLSNLFAYHAQPSPLRLIRARLAMAAKRLLHYTDQPTKQIATELGFADVTTFSRFFRTEVGTSPAAFRRHAPETPSAALAAAGNEAKLPGSPALHVATDAA